MNSAAAEAIDELGLAPHPFEGWFKEVAHAPGEARTFDYLIAGETHVPWYRLDGDCLWQWTAGDPAVLSMSPDGVVASALPLRAAMPRAEIERRTYQTVSCLGRYCLLRVTLTPDLILTDREHCPDDWFPGRR